MPFPGAAAAGEKNINERLLKIKCVLHTHNTGGQLFKYDIYFYLIIHKNSARHDENFVANRIV